MVGLLGSILVPLLAAAPTWVDAGVFVVAALVVLGGALGVILSRNAVHSALSLVLTLFGIAVLFVAQGAHFLAAVQVIVYAGAIVILFLFVIMLLGVDREENVFEQDDDKVRFQLPVGLALGALVLLEMLLLARVRWSTGPVVEDALPSTASDIELLGRSIFTTYLLPFEATSVLLVIAVVGAVVLARRPGRRDTEEVGR